MDTVALGSASKATLAAVQHTLRPSAGKAADD